MTEQLWTIVDTVAGTVLQEVFSTSPAGQHPKDAGWDWDASRQRAIKLASRPDPATQVFSLAKGAWAEDPAKVEPLLVAQLKAEAELRKMVYLSPGGAKKDEYSRQYDEVLAWEALGPTAAAILIAFNALTAPVKALRFEYALASAAEFGDTPAAAIARFKAGITKSANRAKIAAREQKLCTDIRAAATAAEKRAIAAAAAWPA